MNEVKPTSSYIPVDNGEVSSFNNKASKTVSATETNVVGETTGSQKPESQPQDVKENTHVTDDQLEDAVTKLNDYVQSTQRDLVFSVDDKSEQLVVIVSNSQTKEVIRQIPDEVTLELARKLNDEEPLRLFSAHV